MFETIISSYKSPMFLLLPVGASAVSMGFFLLFAVPLTWIAWKEPRWAVPWRIQSRAVVFQRQVWPSVRLWLANNLAMFALVCAVWPVLNAVNRIHTGPLPPWYLALGQILAFIVLDDFVYYWMHRTLHRGWLYKRIHSVHHRIATPWAITAHYMHPVEFILTGSLTLFWPMLFGAHLMTTYLWIIFRQWEAAEGHCGYSFPWSPSKLFWPLYDGVEYHDFHHSKFRGNYAGFLSYLDRFFGGYSKGYLDAIRGRKSR